MSTTTQLTDECDGGDGSNHGGERDGDGVHGSAPHQVLRCLGLDILAAAPPRDPGGDESGGQRRRQRHREHSPVPTAEGPHRRDCLTV